MKRPRMLALSVLCLIGLSGVAAVGGGCGDDETTAPSPTGTAGATANGGSAGAGAEGGSGGTVDTGGVGGAGAMGGSTGGAGGAGAQGGAGGSGGGAAPNRWTDVYATADSIIAFHANGNVYTWGANWDGLLGAGLDEATVSEATAPVRVCADTGCTSTLRVADVAEIDTSDWYVWLRKTDGTVWAFGQNRNGNFAGYGVAGEWGAGVGYPAPVRLYADVAKTTPLANVQDSAVGYQHNVYIASDGSIDGLGWSLHVVDDSANYYQVPQASKSPADFGGLGITKLFSGGFNSAVAVLSDGSVWAWGNYRALGDNYVTTADSFAHKRVCSPSDTHTSGVACTAFLSGVVDAVGFSGVTVQARLDDGRVVTWGEPTNGVHGAGAGYTTTRYKPVEMQLAGSAIAIVTGTLGNSYHTMVATSGGALWACGGNWSGQLGNGDTNDRTLPTQVCANLNCDPFVVDEAGIDAGHQVIARGRNFSAAIKDDGTLWVWGSDDGSGVFANGETDVESYLPVQVEFTP